MPSISFFWPKQADVVLPSTIDRSFVQTPAGPIELLHAAPKSTSGPRKPALFFTHGGCGGAAVWIEWMDYLSQKHNIPCYAVSLRGHGSSWYPWYLRMFFTTKRTFANDLVAAAKHAEVREKQVGGEDKLVLVGHSSGGALSQLVLSDGDIKARGLGLIDAIPNFGNYEVNQNWMRMDPWFIVRMYFLHFGHPMSGLSSTRLVKQAFFCDEYPISKVQEFETRMPRMESFLWPMGMMKPFIKCDNVMRNILGWGVSHRIAVIVGSKDRLTDPETEKKMANDYRTAYSQSIDAGEIEAKKDEVEISENGESKGLGVRYYEVEGAGHHLQNDLQWEEGAERLVDWYEQL